MCIRDRYYSNGVVNFNEREMISENGSLLRPDRLNFSGNSVTVIDYKTGAPNPKHTEQITEYGDLLGRMNFKVDKKILVYINREIEISFV